VISEVLSLAGETDAVPLARAFIRGRLGSWGLPELVADAELIVSELVTNALLHAGPPVGLELSMDSPGLRIAVADTSRIRPLRGLDDGEGMTGRGLTLVRAIATRFGVDTTDAGKVVWCLLDPAGESAELEVDADADARLAGWDDDAELPGRRYRVTLGDVPTDLLLAAKNHVDSLIREFTLAAAGASAGSTPLVPSQLADLIERVVHRFAEARQSIKRQAIAAAGRGDLRVTLTLTLPLDAADAGLDYLAGLDEADAYARDARLLTLESPAEYRVFRRWYVEGLVDHLRRAAAGEPAAVPESFEARLLTELRAITARQRSSERAARLQSMTAALAAATSSEEVPGVILGEGRAVLGAAGGLLALRGPGDVLLPVGEFGRDAGLLRRYAEEGAADPAGPSWAAGVPVWAESLAVVPLAVGGRVVGVLSFSFAEPRRIDSDERDYLLALAAQTAQTLERTRLFEGQRRTAERLGRLQSVTAALAAAPGSAQVLDLVVEHLAGMVGAEVATASLVSGDGRALELRSRRRGQDVSLARYRSYPVDAVLPASEAFRSGQIVVVSGRADWDLRYPELAGLGQFYDRTLVCLPLTVEAQRLGVLTLSLQGNWPLEDDDRAFFGALSDVCAQAIARSLALDEAQDARDKLIFLADASAEFGSSLDYRTALANLARLAVPRLADWCTVAIVENGRLETVAVAHSDPTKVAMAEEVQRRYWASLDAPAGPAEVIRSGIGRLHANVTDRMLVEGAVDEDQLRILRELGMSSILFVPLAVGRRVLGVLTMIRAESGRHYDGEDLDFAGDLARRAGMAIDNARSHRALEETAVALAQSLLPASLPAIPGLELAARYHCAGHGSDPGGDVYDVWGLRRDPPTWAALVADVPGKGVAAAALAALVRYTVRVASRHAARPDDVLAELNDALLIAEPGTGGELFATAVYAELTPRPGGLDISLCSGGHPAALLRRADGSVTTIDTGGGALGWFAVPTLDVVEIRLGPGDVFVAFTDGYLEGRSADGRFADDLLAMTLMNSTAATAAELVGELEAAVLGFCAGAPRDDMALLAVKLPVG